MLALARVIAPQNHRQMQYWPTGTSDSENTLSRRVCRYGRSRGQHDKHITQSNRPEMRVLRPALLAHRHQRANRYVFSESSSDKCRRDQ